MTTPLILHHLTDVHVGPLHYGPTNRLDGILPAPDRVRRRSMEAYVDHLTRCGATGLPDLVILSGDMTSYAAEEEMDAAEDLIRKIVQVLRARESEMRTPRPQGAPFVALVPGNHDLDWSRGSYSEKIARYARMAETLCREGGVISPVYRTSDSGLPVCWDFGNDWNLFIYLFNTTSLGGINDTRLGDIHKALAEHYRALSQQSENIDLALEALREEMRKDPGYIDPDDLQRMESDLASVPRGRIKIAVMHHNLSSLPSEDVEAFDTIVNAGVIKARLIESGFDLIVHGHRHFQHCSHERYLRRREEQPSSADTGMLVISGDSQGCNPRAPFLEMRLYESGRAHRQEIPTTLLEIRSAEYEPGAGIYKIGPEPLLEELISTPLQSAVGEVLKRLGREAEITDRRRVIDTISQIQPYFQQLLARLVDWGDESELWISKFHIQLELYSQIVATDVYPRQSLATPGFDRYLREQYMVRLEQLQAQSARELRFSPPVYDAIIRTGWQPNLTLWKDRPVLKAEGVQAEGLEIVRILVRAKDALHSKRELENLDFDHCLFAVPLFVIDPEQIEGAPLTDFAIGLDGAGKVMRCYEFVEESGKVVEKDLKRAMDLKLTFESLLAHPALQTMDQFLGRTNLISDPARLRRFAREYDRTRKPSQLILDLLNRHLQPSQEKAGLDIGCGTGNYSVPFVGRFGRLVGLDVNPEMLRIAREKTDQVDWKQANALSTGLEDESFDGAWLISTLHYFAGERQKLLFREIFRVLKPGGIVVADTEFAEQHASLWLVEFFPWLRERFAGACLGVEQYRRWLLDVGFREVQFEAHTYQPVEEDAFLRIGQHRPELYLKEPIRAGIPAFVEMPPAELQGGLKKLKEAIEDRSIDEIIDRYQKQAVMEGDIGVIIAQR